MIIRTVRDLATALRRGKYTSVGSYPLFFVNSQNQVFSFEAVRGDFMTFARGVFEGVNPIVSVEVNWENPELYCDATEERIESAYAEPEAS